MATLAVSPITNKQRIMGGQVVFKPKGTNKYLKFGSVPSFEFTPNIQEVESWSAEFGDRRLIGTWGVTKDGTITMTVESWTELLHQALFMSNKAYVTQSAVSSGTLVVEDVAPGDIIRLPGINPTVTAIDDGETEDAVTLTADVHYTVHKTGFIEILALPEAWEADDAVVKYSLPAITEADKLLDLGLMSTSGIRGELVVIGVVADGNPGEEVEQTYWEVELRPSGAVASINTEGLHSATLTGRVFAVSGKSAGKSYGQVRGLEKIA